MLLSILKSKISNVSVTKTELYYEGSITVDADILEAAGIRAGEKVEVLNLNNGSRLETYAICGPRGTGEVCLNGPAARQGYGGDRIIILSYALLSPQEAQDFKAKKIVLTDHNRLKNSSSIRAKKR